eukprot:gb/GFBE01069496.1/.p1 GENE.gb/GFBE01069496.1/~~gb/GFBE01069496.1/.p1  ORF type:complete len:518 (+),score=60.43 gb/GFBE01069496.1/:1-1554(+)
MLVCTGLAQDARKNLSPRESACCDASSPRSPCCLPLSRSPSVGLRLDFDVCGFAASICESSEKLQRSREVPRADSVDSRTSSDSQLQQQADPTTSQKPFQEFHATSTACPLQSERTLVTDVSCKSVVHRVSSYASRRSSESLNFSRMFEEMAGEWWLPDHSLQHPGGNFETKQLKEGWWGSCPERRPNSRTSPLTNGPFRWLRRKVADKRHRYDSHGFDLDLAYVTSRVIAMGFPSRGAGTCFRNPQSEVGRFLRWAHGDKHFRIYNLCAEKSYRDNGFTDETVSFPCADHCPPDFRNVLRFCQDAEAWLKGDDDNVVAIHCKAGKGRSGTMLSALLVYAGAAASAQEALRWFGTIRGGTRSGVTIPSQIRWVAMFENWLRGQAQLSSNPVSAFDLRYRASTMVAGPLCSDLCKEMGTGERMTVVQVGLASRSTPGGLKVVHWYRPEMVTVNNDSMLTLTLPDDGPIWTEADGMVCVRFKYPGGRSFSRRSLLSQLKVSAWWHHAFLKRVRTSSWRM